MASVEERTADLRRARDRIVQARETAIRARTEMERADAGFRAVTRGSRGRDVLAASVRWLAAQELLDRMIRRLGTSTAALDELLERLDPAAEPTGTGGCPPAAEPTPRRAPEPPGRRPAGPPGKPIQN